MNILYHKILSLLFKLFNLLQSVYSLEQNGRKTIFANVQQTHICTFCWLSVVQDSASQFWSQLTKIFFLNFVDYAETRFSNFASKYLRKNEKVRETVFACSCGAQVEYFMQKKLLKSRDTVPLKEQCHEIKCLS